MKKFIAWIKSPASDAWLFVIAVVMLNLVAQRAFFRRDLTSSREYSLSDASREVVRTLEEPLNVRVCFSSDLPAPYSSVEQYVRDILSEYQTAANSNFSLEYMDMDDPENQTIARGYGLRQVQIQEVADNEVGVRTAYMGIALLYADQIEAVDGITSQGGLEYRITRAIGKIISDTNALSGLEGDVTVTLYRSSALSAFGIAGFDDVESTVEDAFAEANRQFQGRLRYETRNPSGEEARALVARYGIWGGAWDNADGTQGFGAFGLVAEWGDRFVRAPLDITNILIGYAVTGADDLAQDIADCVRGLVSASQVVAYTSGHGEKSLSDESLVFRELLSDTYEVQEVLLSDEDIPAGAQSLIINGPTERFTGAELYKIDQFVMRGGNLMLFLDPYREVSPEGDAAYYGQGPTYEPLETGLETLLDKWGLSVEKSYVMDAECVVQYDRQYGEVRFYYAPLVQRSGMDGHNDATRNLGNVLFLQAGPIETHAVEDVEFTTLAETSARSWREEAGAGFALNPMFFSPPPDEDEFAPQDVAVLAEGTFPSAYDAPPVDSAAGGSPGAISADSHIARGVQSARVFLASTSYITTSTVLPEGRASYTGIFLRNCADILNGKDEYCAMRTKGLSTNTLRATSGAAVTAAQYFNEFALAVLAALAGVIVLLARRARRERIRRMFAGSAADADATPGRLEEANQDAPRGGDSAGAPEEGEK